MTTGQLARYKTGQITNSQHPLYRAKALGKSADGKTATDHDATLYSR
jgi:hypothetical protein